MSTAVRILRRFLHAWERRAIEFPNDGALKKYLDQHPKAKRENHWIKGQKPSHIPTNRPKRQYVKKQQPQAQPAAPKTGPSVDLSDLEQGTLYTLDVIYNPKEDDAVAKVVAAIHNNEQVPQSLILSAIKNLELFDAQGNYAETDDKVRLKAAIRELKKLSGAPEGEEKPQVEMMGQNNGTHPLQGVLKVVKRKRIGEGIMGAEFVDVKDKDGKTHKAVWKSSVGEKLAEEREGGPIRDHVEAGTYYEREALCSDVDDIFGGKRVVPNAYIQEIEDRDSGELVPGSIHEFIPGTVSSDQMKEVMYRPHSDYEIQENFRKLASSFDAKKQFFMDLITGNDDRHSGNTLWKKDKQYGFLPVAIDNGLTFPDGETSRFMSAVADVSFFQEVMKPSEEIHQCFENMAIKAMADKLNGCKALSINAKVLTLARMQALKNNPDLMVNYVGKKQHIADELVHGWVNRSLELRVDDGELTQDELDNLYKLVGATPGQEYDEEYEGRKKKKKDDAVGEAVFPGNATDLYNSDIAENLDTYYRPTNDYDVSELVSAIYNGQRIPLNVLSEAIRGINEAIEHNGYYEDEGKGKLEEIVGYLENILGRAKGKHQVDSKPTKQPSKKPSKITPKAAPDLFRNAIAIDIDNYYKPSGTSNDTNYFKLKYLTQKIYREEDISKKDLAGAIEALQGALDRDEYHGGSDGRQALTRALHKMETALNDAGGVEKSEKPSWNPGTQTKQEIARGENQ
jgi:hypothetical protein